MKIIRRILILFAIATLMISACAPGTEIDAPEENRALEDESVSKDAGGTNAQALMEFTDDLGNVLEFETYPQAIVSLSPSTTEILFAVGAGSQVTGRDEMSLYPEEAAQVESVGAMWGDLPAEAILAAEPDLVVVAEIISPETVSAMQDLGLQVYWQANPLTFEDLYQNILDIAELTGHAEQAQTIIPDLQARVAAVEETVSAAQTTSSVFYELDATDPANPWTAGGGTFIDYIITLAGGENLAATLEGAYAQISSEVLIENDPQVIVLADAYFGVSEESVAERAGWDVITAVRNGDVFPTDPDILSVPGPRLVDGLEAMARILHPSLFVEE